MKNSVKRWTHWLRSLFTSKPKRMKFLKADEQGAEQLTPIIGTGKSKHLPKDSEHLVHPDMADLLVKEGKAKLTKEDKAEKVEKKEVEEKNKKAGPNDPKK